MTQIVGIYCSYCHRRYVRFIFDNGPICKHHYGRVDKIGILAPATFIYSFAWRYKDGFQSFSLQKIHYPFRDGGFVSELVGEKFGASYVTEQELKLRFLGFLKAIELYNLPVWMEAFVSLAFGGPGATMIPGWRWRQMEREFEKEIKANE